MELWTSLIDACGSALVAGLFGVVMWFLQRQEKQGKVRDEDTKKRLEMIQANTAKLADHDALIVSLSQLAKDLKVATDQNSDGVKVLMRYMLQRYHATYMMRGFITSHENRSFWRPTVYITTKAATGQEKAGCGKWTGCLSGMMSRL